MWTLTLMKFGSAFMIISLSSIATSLTSLRGPQQDQETDGEAECPKTEPKGEKSLGDDLGKVAEVASNPIPGGSCQ